MALPDASSDLTLHTMSEALPHLMVGVDLGTTSCTVSFEWMGSKVSHLLKFPTHSNAKNNEELDAILACSQDRWYYGENAQFRPHAVLFEHIKLAAMGRKPYTSILKRALREAATNYGTALTILNLFEKIFSYILEVLEVQLPKLSESSVFSRGRRFDEIQKYCRVTYPVEYNVWLRMMLFEAARSAGFDEVAGVSEPLAAAHYIAFESERARLPSQAMLIIDSGGGSTVRLRTPLIRNSSSNSLRRMAQRYILMLKKSSWPALLMVRTLASIR
ncbi:uncharacterized protein N7511_011354 [Penicillium nucicola]|uniref:uncharacterized protein n=1 Tax=Penicillium nucicola TaxID=1850975 RepID=UPI0025457720|nr:uncharacterized protein N7511_011354 [Penicillium nucicola]KAJ5742622.1 hypothetical protein N7511_011354 [Penicillium nucicola]